MALIHQQNVVRFRTARSRIGTRRTASRVTREQKVWAEAQPEISKKLSIL